MSVQCLKCSQFDLKAAASAGRARNCLKTVFFGDERIFWDESSCYIEFVHVSSIFFVYRSSEKNLEVSPRDPSAAALRHRKWVWNLRRMGSRRHRNHAASAEIRFSPSLDTWHLTELFLERNR